MSESARDVCARVYAPINVLTKEQIPRLRNEITVTNASLCQQWEKEYKRRSTYVTDTFNRSSNSQSVLPQFDLSRSNPPDLPLTAVSWIGRNSDNVFRLICPYHACSLAKRTLDNTEKRKKKRAKNWRRSNHRRNRRLDRSASKNERRQSNLHSDLHAENRSRGHIDR